MKGKFLGFAVLSAAFAGSALAQNQISGTHKCGKADTSQTIEVGDQAGHVLGIEKGTCTWSAPFEIAGLKSTTDTQAYLRYCRHKGSGPGIRRDHDGQWR